MTGEKDPRDVMQAEHDARLSEHPAFRAPAEMPGVEEIGRVLFEFATCTDIAKGPAALDANAGPFARAVLALFAPILAEKDKDITKLAERLASAYEAKYRCNEDANYERARALAAEAALAAVKEAHLHWIRERGGIGMAMFEHSSDRQDALAKSDGKLFSAIAAAIRAQGARLLTDDARNRTPLEGG